MRREEAEFKQKGRITILLDKTIHIYIYIYIYRQEAAKKEKKTA